MAEKCNPNDRFIWALAPIIEKLADTSYKKDRAAFSEAANMIDSTPGQMMRGIASFAWMATNFPRDIGGEEERMRDAMQLVGMLSEAVDALISMEIMHQNTVEIAR